MLVSVVVRTHTEEEAIALALENVHDSTILDITDVEEFDECSTKQTPSSKLLPPSSSGQMSFDFEGTAKSRA